VKEVVAAVEIRYGEGEGERIWWWAGGGDDFVDVGW